MTKLLLTSAGTDVQEEIVKILPKPATELKLAHVITASKPELDKNYMLKDRQNMIDMGFNVEDVDIEGKNEEELRKIFKDKDIICVQGGNTFYLLKQVRESGFDMVVKDYVNQGKIYIGISAGSYITCPTIEQAKSENLIGLTDLTGMKLIPFYIYAHFEEKKRYDVEKIAKNIPYPLVVLYDTQAVLVIDGKWKVVGMGKKEFYNGFEETLF